MIERILLALLAVLPSLGRTDATWRRVRPGLELELPRDHGAHFEHRTEWWYLTGHLETAAGRRFGFQFTIFRHGLDARELGADESPLRARQVFAGHLALADLEGRRFLVGERLRRPMPGFAEASSEDLELRLEDWTLVRTQEDRLRLAGTGRDAAFGIELELSPEKPLVLHGDGGYSQKGAEPGNASSYTSWTRLDGRGRVVLDGTALAVQGQAWYDHEWGTSQLGQGVVGWDWFSLQLVDGRELMVYALRRRDGTRDRFSSGTLVEADGTARRLEPQDFEIEVTEHWESPASGGRYPAGWILRAADLELRLRPLLADCELVTEHSTGVTYWEGPVEIEGGGLGYVELTGYAGSLESRF